MSVLLKSPEQVLSAVQTRLENWWASTVTGQAEPPRWPHAFRIGDPSGAQLAAEFTSVVTQVATWRTWESQHGLRLVWRDRRVMGTTQEIPTHVEVPHLDAAAELCGGPWPARISRGRARSGRLSGSYAHLSDPARVLRAVDSYADVDFDLLCRAADWFATHDASGFTPRQVPIEGLHAKWLNTRHALVREIAGVEDLGLLPPHPARIHFTYLDPGYRAAGGRLHDSATVGDAGELPYVPRVVIISENKDTAIWFPEVGGGVSVEGVGRGGMTAAAFDWIRCAPDVFYWGDMDADGLEILDGFRAAGIPARSLLMDGAAYARWERFGTNTDKQGRTLQPRAPRPVPYLTPEEAALYHQLISAQWTRNRRVEQERIPLSVAAAELYRLTNVD